MKKVILLAAFGVAGLANAKTADVKVPTGLTNVKTYEVKISEETKKEDSNAVPFQLCGVSVTYYDGDGNITGYDLITSDQSSLENCQMWQSLVIHRLQKKGFIVSMD
ncbi:MULTISPECIES: hypothetical protein [Chryseobacterium]|uniref:hypothetical protein n=1 Tax=Chryseobacterium TaxID=59732 RepID=UPI00129527F4|nr:MULTISPECIES: hypothetical protein [Chryseobacterium]MDR6919615.1 hypothetical protein [Chryseobacterium sp. 2987]